jgi:hypothetical protein
MGNYLSPGVYTRETDFSFYVKQLSTSACGMIGVTERGPVNKPVLVTSWEQFVNKLGSYVQAGYLAYAARAFFDNGGSILYVNRVVHLSDPTDRDSLTAAKSSATLGAEGGVAASLTTGIPGENGILWMAREPGVEGNEIVIALMGSVPQAALSVWVEGKTVMVQLAADGEGVLRSTAPEVVAADFVRHALSRHGEDAVSGQDGQLALTVEDFARIPEIAVPENVFAKGPLGSERRTYGQSVVYEMQSPEGFYYFLEEIRTGKGDLSAKTLVKARDRQGAFGRLRRGEGVMEGPGPGGSTPNVQNADGFAAPTVETPGLDNTSITRGHARVNPDFRAPDDASPVDLDAAPGARDGTGGAPKALSPTEETAAAVGIDPETGAFFEEAEVRAMLDAGEVTELEKTALLEADLAAERAEKYGLAYRAAVECVLSTS